MQKAVHLKQIYVKERLPTATTRIKLRVSNKWFHTPLLLLFLHWYYLYPHAEGFPSGTNIYERKIS
jgi:hypothetical protein